MNEFTANSSTNELKYVLSIYTTSAIVDAVLSYHYFVRSPFMMAAWFIHKKKIYPTSSNENHSNIYSLRYFVCLKGARARLQYTLAVHSFVGRKTFLYTFWVVNLKGLDQYK